LLAASTFGLENFMATGELGGRRDNIKMDVLSKGWFEYFVLGRYFVQEDVDLKEIITGVYLQQFTVKRVQENVFRPQITFKKTRINYYTIHWPSQFCYMTAKLGLLKQGTP